ncbi:GMC family oxidoreductase N-terminal domain-containing protein [Amaricoccus sp.]|uniref:GMC family oxidoreductase n=1 Tax=Amaricoccus sp. TaxID=1872485 RepID=UPI001B3DEEEF|nr:GMC family oxidoreductase N-terminal domain-containing protein [Amaricoccus sp.]MBP7241677.1 GMC family oxidoreductase N-terminal domain-containing protein [Amaricoccus sp.]
MDEADYVIVGAGSAGCVLADRLSADGRARVILVEAGGDDRRFWIRTPIGYGRTFLDPSVNWRFHAEPDPGLDGRAPYVPRGRTLGGSGSINALVWHHGLPADYDDWRDAGAAGWGARDVAPVFARIARRVRADGAVAGAGPVSVETPEAQYHPIRRHFLAAAREIGLPVTADMNGPAPEGVGPYPLSTRDGRRCSAADAFLRPALRRPNLAVLTDTLAVRVIFDGVRAAGVEIRRHGATRVLKARREVILAAGAVGSPVILQRSGVGPGPLLQRLGIPVVLAVPAVGGGLQDHVGVNYAYRATEPTLNDVLGTWAGRLGAGARYLLARSGPLALSVNQMGGLVRSRPDAPRPDMQLYFNPLSYSAEFAGARPLTRPDPWPGFILGFNPCRPSSAGRVEIAAADPGTPPRIVTGYLSDEADHAAVLAGARLVGRLQETAAMRALIAAPPVFDPARADDAAILADFRARAGSVYHLCGTCRMGSGGALDPELRLRGAAGLRVADASAFPNVTSANTNAPTIMLAARAAELIVAGN